jgi:hypothetical protein
MTCAIPREDFRAGRHAGTGPVGNRLGALPTACPPGRTCAVLFQQPVHHAARRAGPLRQISMVGFKTNQITVPGIRMALFCWLILTDNQVSRLLSVSSAPAKS